MIGLGLGLGFSTKSGGGGAWTPATPSGLVLWLRADLGWSSPTWNDQSTTAASFTTGGTSPSLTASSVNGKPGLTFLGNSLESLETATHEAALDIATCTIVAVIKPNGALSAFTAIIGNPTSSAWADGIGIVNLSGGTTIGAFAGNYSNGAVAGTPTDGAGNVVRATFDGSTISTWLNGAAGATHAATAANSTGVTSIGALNAGGYFTGDICEIIVWNNVLGGSDIAALSAYMTARYGIAA